jgi:hypothetical protein
LSEPSGIVVLPRDWYRYIVVDGVREDSPGIYEWQIEGRGSYIGKYKTINRPTRAYTRNVANLLNKRPYRLNKPDAFRRIHRELEQAHRDRRKITLIILENVDPADINRREHELIAERGALNDPPYGRR